MAAILKSKMVVSGNNIVRLYIFMTICIWQFPCNFFYIIYLSSFFLKVAKNACKYHKLQSPANIFPQIRFMGIFNMLFVIPFCINWHQKSFDINFFRVQPFSYQPKRTPQLECEGHARLSLCWNPAGGNLRMYNIAILREAPTWCVALCHASQGTPERPVHVLRRLQEGLRLCRPWKTGWYWGLWECQYTW